MPFFHLLFRIQSTAQISMLSFGASSRGKKVSNHSVHPGVRRIFPITWAIEDLKSSTGALRLVQYFVESWSRKPRACSVWWCPWNALSTDALGLDILCRHCEAVKAWVRGTQLPLANQRSLKVLLQTLVPEWTPGALLSIFPVLRHSGWYKIVDTDTYGKYMSAHLFFFFLRAFSFDKIQPQNCIGDSGNYLANHSWGHWGWMGTYW